MVRQAPFSSVVQSTLIHICRPMFFPSGCTEFTIFYRLRKLIVISALPPRKCHGTLKNTVNIDRGQQPLSSYCLPRSIFAQRQTDLYPVVEIDCEISASGPPLSERPKVKECGKNDDHVLHPLHSGVKKKYRGCVTVCFGLN